MNKEIEKAFEGHWEEHGDAIGGGPRASEIRRDDQRKHYTAGYKAGAEAKAQSMTATELSGRVSTLERQQFAAAMKAERARVLEEFIGYVRALKNGWTTDEAWGRAVIDVCELLEHRLKDAQ